MYHCRKLTYVFSVRACIDSSSDSSHHSRVYLFYNICDFGATYDIKTICRVLWIVARMNSVRSTGIGTHKIVLHIVDC